MNARARNISSLGVKHPICKLCPRLSSFINEERTGLSSSNPFVYRVIAAIGLALLLLPITLSAQSLPPEDFEHGWGSWYADNGLWEIGSATYGPPDSAHSGVSCAGTVLNGNYTEPKTSSLISPTFVVPSAPENPRLRFWHWFNYANGDYGRVNLYIVDDGTTVAISPNYNWYSSVWTRTSLDLSPYAGKTVRIMFYHYSIQIDPFNHDVGPGWYIDDIEIVTGPLVLNNPEDFESGLGEWSASNGVWDVDRCDSVNSSWSVPGAAHSGVLCAGTAPRGNYWEPQSSNLVSPPFEVPPVSDNPRLRFWHWFNYANGDYGRVNLYIVDDDTTVAISLNYNWYSSVWTRTSLDLSPYAGKTVRIMFYHHSGQVDPFNHDVGPGWYIDDIEMVTGPLVFNNPEDFESGLGEWSASNGVWQVGTPAFGPGSAHSGSTCAATVLDGNYYEPQSSSLISPSFVVPSSSDNPRLRFWHWFNYANGDYGRVNLYIVDDDTTVAISPNYNWYSSVWTRTSLDLSPYAGKTVRIMFYHHSGQVDPFNHDVGPGWYIDDIEMVTGPLVFNNPEDFESGLGEWSARNGVWQVGTPAFGPGSAHSGSTCAATVLDGNYYEPQSSSLISPPFVVPSASKNPMLCLWHWFSYSNGDYGRVNLYIVDDDTTVALSTSDFVGSSGAWTRYCAQLDSYADKTVQVEFYHYSRQIDPFNHDVGPGWYIDDVEIIPPPIGPICGDVNSDGTIDIDDIIYLINYVYLGGPAPMPSEVGDTNCDGKIDLLDITVLVNYIFRGGPVPCDADADGLVDC